MQGVRRSGEIRHREEVRTQADTASLERNIDRLVYGLYGLAEAEIEVVKSHVGLQAVSGRQRRIDDYRQLSRYTYEHKAQTMRTIRFSSTSSALSR